MGYSRVIKNVGRFNAQVCNALHSNKKLMAWWRRTGRLEQVKCGAYLQVDLKSAQAAGFDNSLIRYTGAQRECAL